MSTYPLWHFRVPLCRASQYVGILDAILGTIGTLVVSIDASDNSHGDYYYRRTVSLFLPGWFAAILISAFLTQVLMGIVLYYAAETKSRSMTQFWVYITALTALFTGMPIRVYELLIILEFYRELKEDSVGSKKIAGGSSSPPQNATGEVTQPPPPYTKHDDGTACSATGEDGNSPKEENGVVRSSSVETRILTGGEGGIGVIGQCQSCHQPTVVFTTAPGTNLHGVQVVGGSGQQSGTQPQGSTSTSAVPTAPVASSSQPQSLNGSQDGVAGIDQIGVAPSKREADTSIA